MAFLTFQKQDGGRYTTVYATTARWGENQSGRRGAQQERIYLGRLDQSGRSVRITKGVAGGTEVRVDIDELKRRVKGGEDVRAWFRSLVPASAAAVVEPVDGTAAATPPGEGSTALVGQPQVFTALAESTGLADVLKAAFGAQKGLALLYLAMHQTARGEPLYLAEAWLDDLWLPPELERTGFSSPELSQLMTDIGADAAGRERFFSRWLEAQKHPSSLIYDTTSISTYAASLEAAAYGYNRDGEALPQVNLAMVCARKTGMPLFIRIVPGSIPDVSTLAHTAASLRELGLREFDCVLDRGFHSNANLRGMLLEGLHFTIGVPLGGTQARRLLKKHRAALNSAKRSICFNGRCQRHIRDEWLVDMGRDKRGKPLPARPIAAHIYFDPRRHADRAAEIEERVFAIEAKAAAETFKTWSEAADWLAENGGFTSRCLGVAPAPEGRFILRRRPHALAAFTANAGYQILVTDRMEAEPTEVLGIYRSRDRIEKLFDINKNENDQFRLRTGIHEVAEGRVILAFLAAVLHAALEERMRQGGLLKNVSVAEFLAEVGKIRAIRFSSGTRLVREVTKRQREWLAAIGLPPPAFGA